MMCPLLSGYTIIAMVARHERKNSQVKLYRCFFSFLFYLLYGCISATGF